METEDCTKAGVRCRDCRYMYSNDTMGSLYICVNGNSENFSQYTGLCCEDICPDGELAERTEEE